MKLRISVRREDEGAIKRLRTYLSVRLNTNVTLEEAAEALLQQTLAQWKEEPNDIAAETRGD